MGRIWDNTLLKAVGTGSRDQSRALDTRVTMARTRGGAMKRLTVTLTMTALLCAGCASGGTDVAAPSSQTTSPITTPTSTPSDSAETDHVNVVACAHVDEALVTAALPVSGPTPSPFGGIDGDLSSRITDAIGATDRDEADPADVGVTATGQVGEDIDIVFASLVGLADLDLLNGDDTSWPRHFGTYIDATKELAATCADVGYDGYRWLPD